MARKRKPYKNDPSRWTREQKGEMNAVLGARPWVDIGQMEPVPGSGSSGSTGEKNTPIQGGAGNPYLKPGADPTDPASIAMPYTGPAVNSSWPAWAKMGSQPQEPPRTPTPDVTAAQPFATTSGRSLEALRESDYPAATEELASREKAVKGYVADPEGFMKENAPALNTDQSLIDKGLDFMGRLFNYQDESDLQVLGLNISTVESVWDTFARYATGSRNVLDTMITAAISAAPGGVETYEWGEITGNKSFGEVLHGDIGLLDNNGPSPMQTAIASVAIEAKRIREGNARLSDILLLNPATAPFILAGIAAPDSPLQQNNFNLLDPAQRKAAFSEGYEKWFSGLGDFGVQMAAPSMAYAAGAKLAFMGALGTTWRGATGATVTRPAFDAAVNMTVKANFDDAVKNGRIPAGQAPTVADRTFADSSLSSRRTRAQLLMAQVQPLAIQHKVPLGIKDAGTDDFFEEMANKSLTGGRTAQETRDAYTKAREKADLTPDDAYATLPAKERDEIDFAIDMDNQFAVWQAGKIRKAAKDAGLDVDKDIRDVFEPTYVTKSADELGITHPLARLINDIAQKDPETGLPVMSRLEIEGRKEFRNNPHKAQLSALLHAMDDPYMIGMVFRAMHNDRDALQNLHVMAASIYDNVYRMRVQQAQYSSQFDADKIAVVKASLEKQEEALERQLTQLTERFGMTDPEQVKSNVRVQNLEDSLAEIKALKAHFDGETIDLMAPGPFHDAAYTERVLRDMELRADLYQRLVREDLDAVLRGAFLDADRDSRLILNDNWTARMVNKSREKKARQRYEYVVEGSEFSRRMKVDKIDLTQPGPARGKMAHRIDRGWAIRDFSNPAHWGTTGRRAVRVWRWFGAENPSGIVGLKGGARAGSMDEISAALDLDVYYGEPTIVTYFDDLTKQVVTDEAVGGAARRQELLDLWAGALADNRIDLKSVIVHIENEIAKDMGKVYGQTADNMKKYREGAMRGKADLEQSVQRYGMFVDPDTASINHVPWLKHQMANVHIMDNWHEVEHTLQRIALDTYGAQAGTARRSFAKAGGMSVDAGRKFLQLGQRLWRPFVLLRAAYPIRNNVEGIGRAMGYYASLAPLAWPMKAAYYGTKSRVAAARAERAAAGVVERVTLAPEFKAARAEFMDANMDHIYLKSAALRSFTQEEWDRAVRNGEIKGDLANLNPLVERRYVYKRGAEGPEITDALTPDEWVVRMADAEERLARAHGDLADVDAAFSKEIKGTKFEKYRDRQLKAYDDEIKAVCSKRGILNAATVGSGGAAAQGLLQGLALLSEKEIQLRAAADILRYDPAGAAAMFKSDAQRLSRMGGGTSLGPGGGSYSNAFDDPFEQFNKGLISADISRRLQLGAESDMWSNVFLQTLTTRNDIIPFSEATKGQWSEAMAQLINQNAHNPLVREMLRDRYDATGNVVGYGNLDWEAGVKWMLTTDEGREFLDQQRKLEGSDFETLNTTYEDIPAGKGTTTVEAASTVRVMAEQQRFSQSTNTVETVNVPVTDRLRPTSTKTRNPVTGFLDDLDDFEAATTYAQRVALSLRWQYQDMPEFLAMLKQKTQSVSNNYVYEVTGKDIEDIINGLTPAEKTKLGVVRGDTEIQMGERPWRERYGLVVSKLFHYIGTVPEDAITRNQFYAKRFKQTRNMLIESYIRQEFPDVKIKRNVFDRFGNKVDEGMSLSEDIKIPTAELQSIMETAHSQALFDTRRYLYTVERRTNLGKHFEAVSPFISSQQNTWQALAKIAWRNPWQVPLVANLWSMPYQNGSVDENGNLQVSMPATWLADKLDLLVEGAFTVIPMNSLNVWSPDSGFGGVIPRPGPIVTWTASEILRNSWLGLSPSTPDAMVAIMGKEQADATWGTMKDFVFGTDFGVSSRTLSWDVWVPPWIRYILDARSEFSDAYARHYSLEGAQRTLIAQANGEPEPTAKEIAEATTNKLLFYAAGAFGLTGGLGRLDIKSPIADEAMKVLQTYLKADGEKNPDGTYKIDPGQAYSRFEALVGPEIMRVAVGGMSDSIGGAGPYDDTVADIRALDPTIRKLTESGILGGQLEILDILVNNNTMGDDYSSDADRWLKNTNIGSAGEMWKQARSGTDARVQADVSVGWTEYQKFQHEQDARMFDMGIDNIQKAAAAPLREKKRIWLENMRDSNPAWYAEYEDGAEKRIAAVVSTLETITQDETFVQRMYDTGNGDLIASMRDYVYWRRQAVILQKQSGYTWGSPINQPLREEWAARQQMLAQKNVRWAEIFTRWLNNDEEPTPVGNIDISTEELAEVASA